MNSKQQAVDEIGNEFEQRTIIAGTRTFGSGVDEARVTEYVDEVIDESGFDIDEVVSGKARGADTAGEAWAEANDIPVAEFPADWDEHGKRAGYLRNKEMAEYGDQLIAIWDGKSRGTSMMIDLGKEVLGEENVHVHRYR